MTASTDGKSGDLQRRVTMWKSFLYQLQQEAPKPAAILCTSRPPDSPSHYGLEYHGDISHHLCQTLLTQEGTYLVRHSEKARDCYTLSFRFNGQIKHYRLYHNSRKHYVGEKRFDTLHDLVADGLVSLYIELKAGEHLKTIHTSTYAESPYYTLTRAIRKQLQATHHSSDKENDLPVLDKAARSTFYVPSAQDESPSPTCDSNEVVNTQRPHRFNVHTFSGLNWCGFCGHFLWGFVNQGVKCQDCSFRAHKQCSFKVPNDCSPDLKNLQSIFGVDLTTSLVGKESSKVPAVVTECITEIEARGLTSEGIYRVPGSQDQVEALKLAFERDGNKVSLNEKAVSDINVVAGVLKLYLRLLPIPVITADCFKKLQTACKLSDPIARVMSIKEALLTLPPAHYSTVRAIILHLGRVYKHSAANKMTATSLSTVLAPTLIQTSPLVDSLQPADLLALANSAQEPRVVEILILYHQDVFQDDTTAT